MQVNSIHKFGASVLVLAMWFGVTALPATVSAQTQPADKTDKKDKKDKNKDKKAESQTQTASTNAKRPLSDNENPDLIGKRNINKGFSGWLGGSQEKDNRLS
jgi:hypothetical protein